MRAQQGDGFFTAGCMPYRAEGSKDRNHVEFTNSDPAMVVWLDVAQLSRDALRKSTVNVYSKYSKKKRQNRLPYGTCRVTVARTRVVQAIYGGIQELAGIEREAWLG